MAKIVKKREGFTVIEVVLVLAIAGLIFLMLFVVVPTAQAAIRDRERRQDISGVVDALLNYQSNNNKIDNLPSAGSWNGVEDFGEEPCSKDTTCIFVRDYLNLATTDGDTTNYFRDPNNDPYNVVITGNLAKTGEGAYDGGSVTVTRGGVEYKSKLEGDGTNDSPITISDDSDFGAYAVYIIPGGKCDGTEVVKSERRRFAILYKLEGSGTYCLDNQSR